MATATGSVVRVHERQAGGSTRYSILLKEADGSENWYSFNMVKPAVTKDQQVEFEYDMAGQYRNAKADTIKVTGAAPAPAASGGGAPSTGDARQKSIVMQSSQNYAAILMDALATAGAIPGLTPKADKLGICLGLFEDLTRECYQRSMNPDAFLSGAPVGAEEATDASDFDPNTA